jgi:hypothetical protein
MVVHTYNFSTEESEAKNFNFEAHLGYIARPSLKQGHYFKYVQVKENNMVLFYWFWLI